MTTASSSAAVTAAESVAWIGFDGVEHSRPVSADLIHEPFHRAFPCRSGVQYQNRLNRHSRQYIASQGTHVWCESALEAETLLWLDFVGEIRQIASQPMKIAFADGSTHFPDFFAVLRNGDQVVYDVKPSERMTAVALEQFSKTVEVCAVVGWRHAVIHEVHPVKIRNLEWLRAARHSRYHPGTDELSRLALAFATPRSFRDGALAADLRRPYLAAAHMRHLLWHGYLRTDFESNITESSTVESVNKEKPCNCGA
ncbi:TnsA-like heteromeric transposase endonuclease subunit [Gordonia sp. CPCC 205515]|uniref:TnsA-like heteromeric transposase endonuclease subunit n=1 Tax=Gordonia sp. CPCC 205515 TaxID=3140791 RepID=UPI003AF39BB0